uniref:Uncharacterized protein n=1 Tax=Trypanosoma congolense (strain IL3000) TaxID=1068625 RepID=G0UUF9_TRYCI|nr:hypothetical protein, unlikely [Trypanosoma congolense IL3000]
MHMHTRQRYLTGDARSHSHSEVKQTIRTNVSIVAQLKHGFDKFITDVRSTTCKNSHTMLRTQKRREEIEKRARCPTVTRRTHRCMGSHPRVEGDLKCLRRRTHAAGDVVRRHHSIRNTRVQSMVGRVS